MSAMESSERRLAGFREVAISAKKIATYVSPDQFGNGHHSTHSISPPRPLIADEALFLNRTNDPGAMARSRFGRT